MSDQAKNSVRLNCQAPFPSLLAPPPLSLLEVFLFSIKSYTLLLDYMFLLWLTFGVKLHLLPP